VHDAGEVDAAVGLGQELCERRLLHDDREGRRRDHVGVARCTGGLGVGVDRVRREDGTGELTHLLATDQVRRGRRERPADELGVH
jgi:hypothetical protein